MGYGAAFALCALAATLALGVSPAAAAARRSPSATVVVSVLAPARVPVNVAVSDKGRSRVLATTGRRARATFTLSERPGRVIVDSPIVAFDGSLYAASSARRALRLRASATLRIRVIYKRLALAGRLRASHIEATRVSLSWNQPGGRAVLLRRVAGAPALVGVRDGVRVASRGVTASDSGLRPGARYTYALFTRVQGRWLGPVAVRLATAGGGPRAAYVAPPSTVLVSPGSADRPRVAGGGVDVALAPGRATPLIGAGFVLPVSAVLPGGYLGKVASISPDGRAVHLVGAGLADAFDYYSIDADLSTLSPAVARASSQSPGARVARAGVIAHSAVDVSCGGSGGGGVVLHPVIQPGGHFSSSLIKNSWGIPVGGQFDLQAQLKVGLTVDVSVTGKLTCGLTIPKRIWPFALDPVPMSLVFDPTVEVNITDQMSVKNVGFTATAGFWVKGQIGAHSSAVGGLTGSASLATPTNTWGSSLGVEVGGELTIGPGGGVDAGGAIAGVGGKFNPVVGSLGPEFIDYGDQRHTKCIKTTLGLESELNVNAKAWLGSWSLASSLTVPALQRNKDYFASPWYWPDGCQRLPAGGGGGGGGASVSVTNPGNQTGTVGTPVSLQIQASDTDNGALAYSAIGLPAGLSINALTGLISGTPRTAASSTVSVTARDASGPSSTTAFSWTITTGAGAGGGGGGGGGNYSNLLNVSCASPSFCVAVDWAISAGNGNAVTYNGSSWSAPTSIDSSNGAYEVSCPSASFCVAVDQSGNALTFNGSSWSAPKSIDTGAQLTSVSCPSASFCAAVDNRGNALTFNGSSWSAPNSVDSNNIGLNSVSCPSASFCVAVGRFNVLTFNGSSWSAPNSVDSNAGLSSVSCPSASFCVAVDDSGHALTFNGSSWSAPTSIDYGATNAVSCHSSSFCVAVDGNGAAVTYNGSSWSAPTFIGSLQPYSVSCPSASFCVAVDQSGHALTYNGSSWSAPSTIASG